MEVKKELPNVTISTEHYDIISSGSVVLQKGEYLDFQIGNLKFRIEFIDEPITDGINKEGRITTDIVNSDSPDAYLKISFYNQNTAFFASVVDFLDLATFNGNPLRLKFSVQAINNRDGSSDKIFFYTWYLGKEASIQTANNVPQQ